jgi:hypothetical protein
VGTELCARREQRTGAERLLLCLVTGIIACLFVDRKVMGKEKH